MAGPDPDGGLVRYSLILLLALAMGLQNATARRLGVPDLTTTVLTMTLSGLVADSALAGGKDPHPGRRLLATATMFLGAAVGALLVFHVGVEAVLALATALQAADSGRHRQRGRWGREMPAVDRTRVDYRCNTSRRPRNRPAIRVSHPFVADR
jgi:hypothetical protein